MIRRLIHKMIATDIALQRWVDAHQEKTLRKILKMITFFGSGYAWLLAYFCMFILGSRKLRSIVTAVVWAELLGLMIIMVSRNFIKRERPIQNPAFVIPLPWQRGSFPSHHALRAALLAAIAATYYPAWSPLITLLVIAIPASRIYLGKHYFYDACAGLITGYLCARSALLVIPYQP